jgi:hypothetical protein
MKFLVRCLRPSAGFSGVLRACWTLWPGGSGARRSSRHAQAFVEEGGRLADIDDHLVGRVGVDLCQQRVRIATARNKVNPARQPEPLNETFGQ